MRSAISTPNTSSNTGVPTTLNCDCGSKNAAQPCYGKSVEYTSGTSTIRFEFECSGGACKCGKFSNQHDYWIAPTTQNGVIHITKISPASIGTPGEANYRNGWVVNPDNQDNVGLDGRFYSQGNFQSPQNPSAQSPYIVDTSLGIQSIWKADHYPDSQVGSNCTDTAPNGDTRMCFLQTALLTVLPNTPESAGATVLRPPYFGATKTLYSTNQLDLSFFPNLSANMRPDNSLIPMDWDKALGDLRHPDADWGKNYSATQVHHAKFNWHTPMSNGYPAYEPQQNRNNALSLLMFATNSDEERAKKELLKIRAVQQGLDILAIIKHGNTLQVNGVDRGAFAPNGGHAVGRYTQALIAAHAISKIDTQWKQLMIELSNSPAGRLAFPETGQFSYNSSTNKYVYGVTPASGAPATYLPNCETGITPCQSNSILADPAGNYDDWPSGGNQGAYQGIAWNSTFFAVTMARAIPALRTIIYSGTESYVRRMISIGTYTNPSVSLPLTPLSFCSSGVNTSRVCRTDNDCGSGISCLNRQTNFSVYIWPATNAWQAYDSCFDTKTCQGMEGL